MSTPSTCDLCGKGADPAAEDCWQVVCVASHPEDYYHERCIQKFMRAMPGKNYDPSRRSGLPCPRGVGKGTQYTTKCPGKVAHCQKVVVKSSARSAAAGSNKAAAPAQAATAKVPAAAKPAAPKPKPAAKPPAPPSSKPHKAPESTWVPPSKAVVLEPTGPKPDPLGRNVAMAAAVSAKAAKKNAKRAAAKQQKREQEAAAAGGPGPSADGSISDTSSMAESGALGSTWSGAGRGDEGEWGEEHAEELGLDADQLLLLQLLKQQRQMQPHQLLFHTEQPASDSSDEEDQEEAPQQQQQEQQQQQQVPGIVQQGHAPAQEQPVPQQQPQVGAGVGPPHAHSSTSPAAAAVSPHAAAVSPHAAVSPSHAAYASIPQHLPVGSPVFGGPMQYPQHPQHYQHCLQEHFQKQQQQQQGYPQPQQQVWPLSPTSNSLSSPPAGVFHQGAGSYRQHNLSIPQPAVSSAAGDSTAGRWVDARAPLGNGVVASSTQHTPRAATAGVDDPDDVSTEELMALLLGS